MHAKSILKAMSSTDRDVSEASGEISGDVSVGIAYSAVKAIAVELIRTLEKEHPRVRLSLTESLSGTTLIHLLMSEVDVALVYNPPNDSRLKRLPVLREQM